MRRDNPEKNLKKPRANRLLYVFSWVASQKNVHNDERELVFAYISTPVSGVVESLAMTRVGRFQLMLYQFPLKNTSGLASVKLASSHLHVNRPKEGGVLASAFASASIFAMRSKSCVSQFSLLG